MNQLDQATQSNSAAAEENAGFVLRRKESSQPKKVVEKSEVAERNTKSVSSVS